MEMSRIKDGRYILYLDILGFKQLVQNCGTREVYEIVDTVLAEFARRQARIHEFRTLYFSDTIIFYQEPVGWGRWAFLDIYAIAGMAWSALAAHGIPCRGAISFGDFHVELDSLRRHSIFFGRALIEAYETESSSRNSEWIGVTVCPSAWQTVEQMEPGLINSFASEGRWLRQEDCLRLNPFMKLQSTHVDFQVGNIEGPLSRWDAPDFPNDVKALAFILDEAEKFRQRGDRSSRVAVKYHVTAKLLAELLGDECVRWARGVATTL